MEDQLYLEYLSTINGNEIYVVDNKIAKMMLSMDIVEGDNWKHSDLIPKPQIWIMEYLDELDRKCIIAHEVLEVFLMDVLGLDYEHAHPIANMFEYTLRADDAKKK